MKVQMDLDILVQHIMKHCNKIEIILVVVLCV